MKINYRTVLQRSLLSSEHLNLNGQTFGSCMEQNVAWIEDDEENWKSIVGFIQVIYGRAATMLNDIGLVAYPFHGEYMNC